MSVDYRVIVIGNQAVCDQVKDSFGEGEPERFPTN